MKKTRHSNFCGSSEHDVSRRAFLGSAATGAAALMGGVGSVNAFDHDVLNSSLKRNGRNVILLWLAGGPSQLETWDPKPGAKNGGPFASIPTSVPGVHISELMPKMARRMEDLCLIRSMNTGTADHGGASVLMMRGRRDEPSLKYPDMGAIVAKELGRANSRVPDYVSFYSSTEGQRFSKLSPAFLGAEYAPIRLSDSMIPPNLEMPESIQAMDHSERAELRNLMAHRFEATRSNEVVRSHSNAYARVNGLMSSQPLFTIEDEPQKIRDWYGPTLFGQQALAARRLVEAGVPFVRVARAWWDSHGQNFETHLELVPELDRVMSTLIDDLKQRGLLDSTLVIAMGEFGRTPKINPSLGRDHFARAWSVAMAGCGVQGGAVYGATSADGEEVTDGDVGSGDLFATILSALGINPHEEYYVGSRPIPLVNPGCHPVDAVLA